MYECQSRIVMLIGDFAVGVGRKLRGKGGFLHVGDVRRTGRLSCEYSLAIRICMTLCPAGRYAVLISYGN